MEKIILGKIKLTKMPEEGFTMKVIEQNFEMNVADSKEAEWLYDFIASFLKRHKHYLVKLFSLVGNLFLTFPCITFVLILSVKRRSFGSKLQNRITSICRTGKWQQTDRIAEPKLRHCQSPELLPWLPQ